MGPAYISLPEEGSQSQKMLSEIGVLKYARIESSAEKEIFLNTKVVQDFWSGQHEDLKVFAELRSIFAEITSADAATLSNYNKMTVSQWILQYFPQITATLREYFQYYCWSSFGATLDEVAAGEFLSWQAAEQKRNDGIPWWQ